MSSTGFQSKPACSDATKSAITQILFDEIRQNFHGRCKIDVREGIQKTKFLLLLVFELEVLATHEVQLHHCALASINARRLYIVV